MLAIKERTFQQDTMALLNKIQSQPTADRRITRIRQEGDFHTVFDLNTLAFEGNELRSGLALELRPELVSHLNEGIPQCLEMTKVPRTSRLLVSA